MALGGGTFKTMNKPLPGIYHNFISAAKVSSTLSERGIAAVPFIGDWGAEETVIKLTSEDFLKKSLVLLGYPAEHDKMVMWRELFANANTVYAYRLNTGTKAENKFCVAKYSGIRGNSLKTVVYTDADNPSQFDVLTYLENTLMDIQTVNDISELQSNEYVTWKKEVELQAEAGVPLIGGTNEMALAAGYQNFLNVISCQCVSCFFSNYSYHSSHYAS